MHVQKHMEVTGMATWQIGLALEAYGIELRLWKEADLREWGATLRDGATVVHHRFEEDNLTLAKLHVLGEARTRAVSRSGSTELPGCDTFFNSWKPIKMERPAHQ
jgi:hypothetical protein